MKFKKVVMLIELLSVTCMVSVGFSSWLAISSPVVQIEGNIETYKIVNHNKYISVSNMSISDYDANGFYTDFIYSDGTSNICKVEFDLTMNYNQYMIDIYGRNTTNWSVKNFDFDIDLGYSTELIYDSNYEYYNFFDLIGRSTTSSSSGTYGLDTTPSKTLTITHTRDVSVNSSNYSSSNFDSNPSCNNIFRVPSVPVTTTNINVHLIYTFTTFGYSATDHLALMDGIPFLVNYVVMEGKA